MGSSFSKLKKEQVASMKFTAIVCIALVACATAAPQRQKTVKKAQHVANAAANKGLSKVQAIVQQYNLKGADGKPLNVRKYYNEAVSAAQANTQVADIKTQVENKQAELKAHAQPFINQADTEIKEIQAQFGDKTLKQILAQLVNKAASQITANVQHADAKALALNALNSAKATVEAAIDAQPAVANKSLEQMKVDAVQQGKVQLRANNLPVNEQQALNKANARLNAIKDKIVQA